jgi:hypothetical protein
VRASEISVARESACWPPSVSPALQAAGEGGEEHDADRHAHDAEGELVEPVGVGEPGDGAFEEARHLAADQEVDLHDAARERGGGGDDGEALEFGRHPRAAEAEAEARAGGRPPDERELRDAAERDGQRERGADAKAERLVDGGAHGVAERAAHGRTHEHRGDEDEVEEDRRGGGGEEAPGGVQHARDEGRQRDEEDVGEGEAAVFDGEVEAFVTREARGHGVNERGHEDDAEDGEDRQDHDHRGPCVLREAEGVLVRLHALGEHRHEGHVERPFGEEAAEEVREREGDQERLGHRAGAEEGRDQDIAGEAEDARQERPEADGHEARDQADRLHVSGRPVARRVRSPRAGVSRAPSAWPRNGTSARTCP